MDGYKCDSFNFSLPFILPCSLLIFIKNEERNHITEFSFSTLPNFQVYPIYKAQPFYDKSFLDYLTGANSSTTRDFLFCLTLPCILPLFLFSTA